MEDCNNLIKSLIRYPCIWKPYHKDYDNQKVVQQAWADLTKDYYLAKIGNPDATIVNVGSEQMINNVKTLWLNTFCSYFTNYIDSIENDEYLPQPANFGSLSYLKCGLTNKLYKKYGYAEMFYKLMNWRAKLEGQNKDNRKLDAAHDACVYKGSLEKAVLVNFVRTNPWLWESKNVNYGNAKKCEESWRSIAKQLSGSDDYYCVWKYQRMWQALVQRFLVQFTEKPKLCSHFDQIKEFIVDPKMSVENQVLNIKGVEELSIHFVKITNAKLAKENKRYELRPDVIQGYSKIIKNEEISRMKLEESENAPYFAAMQELLKKR